MAPTKDQAPALIKPTRRQVAAMGLEMSPAGRGPSVLPPSNGVPSEARAATMFEQLVQTEALRSRVLVVENLDTKPAGRDRIVATITDFILKHTASAPKAKVVWSPS